MHMQSMTRQQIKVKFEFYVHSIYSRQVCRHLRELCVPVHASLQRGVEFYYIFISWATPEAQKVNCYWERNHSSIAC